MIADVISLASRRPQPPGRGDCPGCRRGADGKIRERYPHRLDSLASRLQAHLDHNAGELLIPREELEDAVADAFAVIDSINAHCLPEHQPREVR